jgi:hypothetical protein
MIVDISLPGADMGKRLAFAIVPAGIAALIGPPVTGFLIGDDYSWWKAVLFSSVGTTTNCMSFLEVLNHTLTGCSHCCWWAESVRPPSLPKTESAEDGEYSLTDLFD